MAYFQVQPPDQFNFKQPSEFEKWLIRFERFKTASGLSQKPEDQQVNTLIYCMGKNAEDVFKSFNLTEDQSKKYSEVTKKFKDYFVIRRNTIFERAKFNQRKQEEGESVDSFITSLYSLAEHCEYGGLKDQLIRDRIVVGLRDAKISEKLQLDPNLTLEKAVNQARQKEAVQEQQSVVRSHVISESKLDFVRTKKAHSIKQKQNPQNRKKPSNPSKCTRCGAVPAHGRDKCPAAQAICRGCGKKGHYVRFCLSAKKNVHEVEGEDSDYEFGAYLGTVDMGDKDGDNSGDSCGEFLGTVDAQGTDPWTIDLKVRQVCIRFKIDTGACVSVISDKVYSQFGKLPLEKCSKKLYGPGNKELNVMGSFAEKISSDRHSAVERIYVVKGLERCLLGRPAIINLNLLEIKDQNISEVISLESIKQKHPNLFRELGTLDGEYHITLKEGAKPYALAVPRRVPIPLLPKVKEEIEKMEKNGVISRVDQPTDWCAGMVVAPKPNDKIRICVDLSRLNENVKRENFPLPVIDQSLGLLSGAKYFSKLDANSGFWQIKLSEESRLLTTFITPYGRYAFNRLPMGLNSSSEYFQKKMTQILEGIKGVICQTDDILVYGRTEAEHDQRLDTVLSRLQNANLTLNPEKCEFKKTSIKFVGHIIGSQGISADPERIKSISEMQSPTDVHGVRRFLGMCNQLGKFTPKLAEYSKPIRDLLSPQNQFYWGIDQQTAFEKIKKIAYKYTCSCPVRPKKRDLTAK
ncbi:MAG: reverse transcriptase family protein [Candidatus Thiodiazotropha taylori]|nr:reverse transcriptase family protein [Candidatus Thiodiazotropha taylori]